MESFDVSGVYEPLTDEQKAAVGELARRAEGLELPPSYDSGKKRNPALFFARYLYARKWNVDAAFTMLEESSRWRNDLGLDAQPLFPAALPVRGYNTDELIAFQGLGARPTNQKVDEVFKQIPCMSGWHKWDRDGRVVYIERIGLHQTRALVTKCKQMVPPGTPPHMAIIDAHVHSNEVGGVLARYMSAKMPGSNIPAQVTVIMDCQGLSMGHFYGPGLDLLKAQTDYDQRYYPEGLNRVFVVNAPRIISIGWAIIKMWLDPRVQKKVIFVPAASTRERLLEVISEDALPKFLGGQCDCEGGCCPVHEGDVSEADDAGTMEIQVGRGSKVVKTFPLQEGHTFMWELALDRRDLNIQVAFQPDGSTMVPPPVQQYNRVGRASGTFTAPLNGSVVLTLDNSFAWVHGKTVQLRQSVIDQRAETVQDSEAATETD